MHKCIGFVVSSVAVSSLAASNYFSNHLRIECSNRLRTGSSNVCSNTVVRVSVFERLCFRVFSNAMFRVSVFERQCFRANVRVSGFECFRTRIFELVFLNVSVFECFRTLVLSRQLFRAPSAKSQFFRECARMIPQNPKCQVQSAKLLPIYLYIYIYIYYYIILYK